MAERGTFLGFAICPGCLKDQPVLLRYAEAVFQALEERNLPGRHRHVGIVPFWSIWKSLVSQVSV